MTSSTEKTLENFRQNLRKYRKKQNLTQLKLGIETGVSVDYIQLLEAGKRKPSFDILCKIADVLKIDPYDLLKPKN